MQMRELSKRQYLETMDKMKPLADDQEALADIWAYADELNKRNVLSEYGCRHRLVEAVYTNSDNAFHHVLLFGRDENTYIVIVVDTKKQGIAGHYFLDLNSEYGLHL